MEESFGVKKLWQMDLTAESAKNFGKWTLLQTWQKRLNACTRQEPTRWRRDTIKTCAVRVEINANPSAKWLHITILEVDTPFGGM